MAINRYTKDIIMQRQTPDLVDPNAIQNAGLEARVLSNFSSNVGQAIQEKQIKQQTREDTINRARVVNQLKQEFQDDFVSFSQQNDLTDPESVKKFGALIRSKASSALGSHKGSMDSLASLETQLMSLQDGYITRMSETSRNAQTEFIMNTAGNEINRISRQVYEDPSYLDTAMSELSGVMFEFGGAMETIDELNLVQAAQGQLIQSGLDSFLDRADYQSARELIDANPDAVNYMTPQQQRSVISRINSGLQAQEKERVDTSRKINALRSAAKELGVEIPNSQIYTAVTGIGINDTPEQRVQKFAQVAGMERDQISPAVVAKIGFGVDLPSAGDIDMNKERLPDGGYTPKGIGAQIKTPFDLAANTKVQVEKVLLQADEFMANQNKQAGLASMIAFQKLIDDGAAVREGDIKLSAQGNSALDNIQLMLKRIGEGAIATPQQIAEMKRSAEIFGQSVLEASKTQIDPFLQEAERKGYRMLDIGLPRESYDRVFGKTKTDADKSAYNSQIEQKAKQYGMSVSEYLSATAKKHNMSVQDVAKKLNYTGTLK